MLRIISYPLLALFTFALVACGGDSSSSEPRTGMMSMSITDAPVEDVERVQLSVAALAFKPRDGAPFHIQFEEPVVIDNLLDLQGTNAAPLLAETDVPAGPYNWVRLYVIGGGNDSYVIHREGGQHELFIPGQQPPTGQSDQHLQLVSGFVVPAGGSVDLTLDVDLRRALVQPSGVNHYLLRPALRITDNSETGTITGRVAEALLLDEACSNDLANDRGHAVYLYAGQDVPPGDVYLDQHGEPITDNNPLTTANVRQDVETGEYHYTIGFVPQGEYTIAFTCQALDDQPDQQDEIAFHPVENITVVAGETVEQDFE